MAETGKEPSMEEILASIKRIIVEDADSRVAASPKKIRSKTVKAQATDAQVAELTTAPDQETIGAEQILELTDTAESHSPDESGETLVSRDKEEAMRNSLSALATLSEPGVAPQIVRSGETSMEQLVREILRPMMKDWLDKNLPDLVEQMVAKEISRITRKG